MRDECAEEANIADPALLAKLRPVSCISYQGFNPDRWGLKPDVLFCFDLELPPDFVPTPVDGEVACFTLMSIDEIVKDLRDWENDNWKPNVGVVLVDFLIRHGFVSADDRDYLELVDALRSGTCR